MRRVERLYQVYDAILNYTGKLLLGLALVLMLPLTALIFYPNELQWGVSFAVSAAISAAIGAILVWRTPLRTDIGLTIEEGGVLVLIIWVSAIVLSALPFTLAGLLSWENALFESVSGWTTTGLSVMDVSETPHVFLLWRSIMQLGGGAGLAVMMLATIIGPYGLGLYRAEGRTDQLLPHVRRSTILIMKIYFGYVAGGIVLYVLAGMPVFDAVNHAFAAMSTGGFSTRTQSIGDYNSVAVEAITLVLMMAGTTNFASHFVLLQGKTRTFLRQGEFRLFVTLLVIAAPALVLVTLLQLMNGLPESFRHSFFQVVSALSTTGFSTLSYNAWNDFGIMVLILLMLVGGGVGSTAGGMKQYRIHLMLKSILWELKSHLLPRRTVRENYIWRGEQKFYVDATALKDAAFYVFLYLMSYSLGVMVFLTFGYPLRDSMFEFASALGTVGLSVGITGPAMPSVIKWTEIAGMTLGRLEFFIIFVSILKMVRDLPDMSNPKLSK